MWGEWKKKTSTRVCCRPAAEVLHVETGRGNRRHEERSAGLNQYDRHGSERHISWVDQAWLSNGLCRYGNSVECCWGWRQMDGGRCQPHCQQGCKHGECVRPDRCKCHPGYSGKACNQGNCVCVCVFTTTTTPVTTPVTTTTTLVIITTPVTTTTTPAIFTTPDTTTPVPTTPAATPDTTTVATTLDTTPTPVTTPDTTTPATTPDTTTTSETEPVTTPDTTTTPVTTPVTTPDTTPTLPTTISMVTTTLNNRLNKDVTLKQRGDVHIPRNPNLNQVWEFDIELGNTADDARDDPEAGVLHCTFDHGLCDWLSDREGDLHWETSHNPEGGQYLSVPELKAGQRSIRGARLAVQIVPPWSHGDLCFSFSHWLTGHHVGVLQLYIRKRGRGQRYSPALWSRTGGHGWRHTQVTLTTHPLDKVLLKAERRLGQRGQIAVDDVTLRQGAC
nr:PREDICTED: nephronectin-like [Paralichthys olivaceus]